MIRSARLSKVRGQRLWWTFVLIGAFLSATYAQPAPKRVLLLHSYERDFPPFDTFVGNFRTEVASGVAAPVQFFELSVQPARSQSAADSGPLLDYVRAAFASDRPDLVVAIGGPAVRFVQEHRDRFFPDIPALLAAVDRRLLQASPVTARNAVVAVANDPTRILDTILSVLPDTKHVFLVVGTSPLEQFWRKQVARDLERYAAKVTFTWSDTLTFDELISRAAALPPNSAIFYVLWSVDVKGVPQREERTLNALHASANAPIFGLHSTQVGRGIVGGPLMAIDQLSRNAAAAAVRILRGESPATVTTPVQSLGRPTFDWRELQRWHIPESRLPSGSVVLFRELSTWERYKWPILGGVSICLLQTGLIVGLAVNRRKRKHAETALANLSRTLMKLQEEERTLVARELQEDLCQRIVALSLQMQDVAGDVSRESAERVMDISKQAAEVAFATQALSRRLYSSKLELLGLGPAVDAFCRELASRQLLEIAVHQQGDLQGVSHYVSLVLFRVLQEALSNAIAHSGGSQFVVELVRQDGTIELSVSDDGSGFDVRGAMRGSGLGLISMQERLNLVSGRLSIQSRPGEGTTVRAWAPLHAGNAASITS